MKKLLVLLLVVVMVVSSFDGCTKKKDKADDANTFTSQEQSQDTENGQNLNGNAAAGGTDTAAVPTVPAPKQTPVGVWDIPVPEINPLGGQDQYTQTGYESFASHDLKYIKNFAEYVESINGDIWTLYVPDNSDTALAALKTYALSLGAQVMDSQYEDRLIFSYAKEDDSIWWGDAIMEDEGYELSIVKQLCAPVGKELTLDTASVGDDVGKISFVTKSDGKRFQTLTVTLPDGEISLEGSEDINTKKIEESVSYHQTLSSVKTNTFVLDSIPQGEGQLNWSISWNPESKPSKVSVLLEEPYNIPYVKKTDELGALKVCNVPFGSVVVEPTGSGAVSYEYGDGFSTEADLTPEGDSLFWLPPGLWNVYLTSQEAGFYESLTRLVPVSSGELTTITLPTTLKSTYYSLNSMYGTPENITGTMKITDTKESGGQGIISLMVEDPNKRDIFPDKENTTIMEGGVKVEITDITRQMTPPSVVLVLDSSGSMEDSMKATIKAAKDFINGLPDKSFVKIVDFDNEVRVLNGDTKEAVLKNISKIKADGYTVLFDATQTGLELLEGKERPALVVFSDGADSRTDGSGKGSTYSKEDIIDYAGEAAVPIYTIGFGNKVDDSTLKQLANDSGGQYFSAKNDKALAGVFAAINSKFGNSFVMTYNRPKEAANADTPIVSLVIDDSGSMNTDPAEEEGCGYRTDKVKKLFHDFVMKIPDQCLIQLIGFQTAVLGGPIIKQEQVTTTDKASILQGIGEMEADGGTPILEALRIAYENLKSVPSDNKVIVFLTDAALEVDEEEQELFSDLLQEIKDNGISILFVGMGVDDKEAVFADAAAKAGGRYVISEDPVVLSSKLEEVLSLIKEKKTASGIPLSISISDKSSSGDILNYMINTDVKFTQPPKSGEIIDPEPVAYTTGTPMKRFDTDVAALLTGSSIPSEETILTKRIPFEVNASNNAMNLAVKEAFLFSQFKGLTPYGKQFLALQLDLKNVNKDKLQYQIPNMSSHFYVNVNNEGMYPASDATWLTETPLTNPGDYEVNVFPDKNKSGMLMFLIPDEPITQLSLHFYDTNYGHINIPLIGAMNQELLQLNKLPTTAPVNIADSFTMTVNSVSDVPKLDIYEAPKESSFRVIEADIKSNVQALLDISPQERLWMKTNTATGPLLVQMNNVTAYTPFGFTEPVMLGPGSVNKVRMVYPIANALAGSSSEIFGDLKDGSLNIPVIKGNSYGKKGGKATAEGSGVKVRVNQLTTLDDIHGYNSRWVVADVTVTDVKDGYGTVIPSDFFELIKDGYDFDTIDDYTGLDVDYSTNSLLYGISGDWAVFDNNERRGFVLFCLSDEETDWSLRSPYLKDLNVPLKKEKFPYAGLLVDKFEIDDHDNEEFNTALEAAVNQAIQKFEAVKSASGDAGFTSTVDIEKDDGKNNIPVPTIVYHGAEKLKSIKTIDDAVKLMQGLTCILDENEDLQYSPEAVVTQGWGNRWDLTNLAMGLIAKCGYTPEMRPVTLTETGYNNLLALCGTENYNSKCVPGISYMDRDGNNKIFVIPFMKDISELKGMVYLASETEDLSYDPSMATIRVLVKVETDEETAASLAGDIGDVLGGGGEDGVYYDYIELLSKDMPLTELCNDAVEIGYMKAGFGKGLRYMAALSTPDGITPGTGVVDTGAVKMVGLRIEFDLPGGEKVHEISLQSDEELDKIVQTVGINLPDLTEESAMSLQGAFTKEYNAAKNPDQFSAIKWYSRNILNRFITAQSTFDREIGEDLGLKLGRIYKERCIMVTSRAGKDNKLHTTIDLIQASNECHNGEDSTVAAYNISSGMFLSSLESSALTGEEKIDYLNLWAKAPEDTSLMFIMDDSDLRSQALTMMQESGIKYPDQMIDRIENTNKVIITTDKPVLYNGEERWAWLEIDPQAYETISVFDTGEHAGMAEYTFSLKPSMEDGGKYIVGAFIGVDVAVWSMANSSLILDDYKQIIQDAMATAKQIGEYLNQVMTAYDAGKNQAFNVASVGGNAPVKVKIKVKWSFDLNVNLAQNIIGFQQGFEDGLSVYFTYARYSK